MLQQLRVSFNSIVYLKLPSSIGNRTDEERVWKLCRALFPGNNEGRWRWGRLGNVCAWLRDEVATLPKLDITGRGIFFVFSLENIWLKDQLYGKLFVVVIWRMQ